jgi:hypothetical protein
MILGHGCNPGGPRSSLKASTEAGDKSAYMFWVGRIFPAPKAISTICIIFQQKIKPLVLRRIFPTGRQAHEIKDRFMTLV